MHLTSGKISFTFGMSFTVHVHSSGFEFQGKLLMPRAGAGFPFAEVSLVYMWRAQFQTPEHIHAASMKEERKDPPCRR